MERIFVISNDNYLAVLAMWTNQQPLEMNFWGVKAPHGRIYLSRVYVCSQIITLSGDMAAWPNKNRLLFRMPDFDPLDPS